MAFQEEVAEKGYIDQAPMLREVREISEKKYGKQNHGKILYRSIAYFKYK